MTTALLEQLCRCCLNECEQSTQLSGRVSSFDANVILDEHFTYADAIYMCTSIKCDQSTANLPKIICDTCLQELLTALLFRTKCLASDSLLKDQLSVSGHALERLSRKGHNEQGLREVKANDELSRGSVKYKISGKNYEEFATDTSKFSFDKIGIESNDEENVIQMRETQTGPSLVEIDVDRGSISENPIVRFCDKTNEANEKSSLNQAQNRSTTKTSDISNDNSNTVLVSSASKSISYKKYKCLECAKEYHAKAVYDAHREYHEKSLADIKFLCSVCGHAFATKQRLTVHVLTHTGEKQFNCDECDKRFATEQRLRCHQRTHTGERPFKCNACDMTFAQGNALKCHKRIHTGEKPYECRICGKCFSQNSILITHMTLHTGKTIKCPDCDKMFSRTSNLILHRREHTGDRPYACSQCTNRYKQKSHLDRHMDTHLGVKYTCDVCKKSYTKRWSLKMHMTSHTNRKPFRCDSCGAEFTRRDKYRKHLESQHGVTTKNAKNAE